jgi:hypothetical protein
MRFMFLHSVLLLIAIVTFVAGCSSPSSAPGTGTPSSGVVPGAAITAVPPYPDLAQLVLLPADIPFPVMNESYQTTDLLIDPTFQRHHAVRGFSHYYLSEKTESPTAVQLGQMIVEFPPGNITPAFEEFENQTRSAGLSRYVVNWLQDPGIGDQSYAYTVIDSSGKEKPMAMIMFRKSNIMESVVMVAQTPDINALTRVARLAAAKIHP